jgi:glycosyltransferase involved in cell wall biosynthesis
LLNSFAYYGGAAVACQRLKNALQKNEKIQVKLLSNEEESLKENENIYSINKGFIQKYQKKFRFLAERLSFWIYCKEKRNRFAFSPANFGKDISNNHLVKEADILHIHWINFGFLSLKNLKKLIATKKAIIWTLHDMWAFTGGCHYAGNCKKYENHCNHCPFFKNPSDKDWSYLLFEKKKKIFENANIHWVGCSQWIINQAQKSGILSTQKHFYNIPNPIDTEVFLPLPSTQNQGKNQENKPFYLLFGAMNIEDKRKGFDYLLRALKILKEKYADLESKLHLLIFGKSSPTLLQALPFRFTDLGIIKETNKMVKTYNQADVFVLPSLEDNLPNTVMESLACGVPVIAFKLGGIPEMLSDEKEGYLVENIEAENLAEKIYKIIALKENNFQDYQDLKDNARKKVIQNFSEEVIVKKYKELYKKTLE